MQKLIDIAKFAALASVVVVAGFVCVFLMQLSAEVKRADVALSSSIATLTQVQATLEASSAKVDGVTGKVGGLIDAFTVDARLAGGTLVSVNRGCVPGPCGTLADVSKTLNTARGTVGQVEIGANHWDRNLTTLDAQELELYTQLDAAVQGVRPVEDEALIATRDLDALATNKDVPLVVKNLANGLGSLDSMLATGDAVETKAMAGYLHPSKNPWVRTYRALQPYLVPAAQIAGALR